MEIFPLLPLKKRLSNITPKPYVVLMRKKGKFQGDLYIKSLNKTKLDENKNLIKIILGKYKLNIKNLRFN